MKTTVLALVSLTLPFASSIALAGKPVPSPSLEGMQVYANGISIGRLGQVSVDASDGSTVLGVVTGKGYYVEFSADGGDISPNPNSRLYFEGAGCTGQAHAWIQKFLAYQGVIFVVARENWDLTPDTVWYVPRGSTLTTEYSYASYYYNKTCVNTAGTTGYPKAYPYDPTVTGLQLRLYPYGGAAVQTPISIGIPVQ